MKEKIAIIGLGYVGLPLAVAFAEKYEVVGFDINQGRINEIKSGTDSTLEVSDELLKSVLVESGLGLKCSFDKKSLKYSAFILFLFKKLIA